jgi:small conductance mechanosensitive channel
MENLGDILHLSVFLPWIYAALTLVVGYIIAKLAAKAFVKASKRIATPAQANLLSKLIKYFVLVIFLITALQQVGFKLSVLLSTAGVLTVAVSFASQTALTNIISGLFFIAERPFRIGDSVTISGITGEVKSIDLLSIKLRTFDNTLVRISNESLLKTPITNLSHYPTRRFDFTLGVAYTANLNQVSQVLLELANNNAYALSTPAAEVHITGFADSAINLRFSVWSKTKEFASLKNSLQQAIQEKFAQENIEIPYPQLEVHQA